MILLTELRRSSAPVLAIGLPVLSLGLVHLLSGPWGKGTAPWNEQWTGLAQWTRYLSLFLWPLVLGIGAWQGLRDARSRVAELFATTPRPVWWRLLQTAGAGAVALAAAYLVLLAVGGVQVASTSAYAHTKWLPVAGVMVLALVGIWSLGFGIGRLVPSLVTPPVLAVAALAGQVAVLQQGWQLLLTPAFEAQDITAFTTVAVPVTLTQALWFTGIGVTGFCLAVAVRARTRFAALLPVALAAAVTLPVLSGVDSPVVADEDARALVCDTDGPRVCVTRAHAGHLPTFAGPARKALALLEKLPSPPTSVVELPGVDGVRSPSADVVGVVLPGAPLTDQKQIRLAVLGGAGTPPCEDREADGDQVTRAFTARIITAAWFTGTLEPVPGSRFVWESARAEIRKAWRELRALPEAEQTARVAAYRTAALDCRGDLSTLVTS